MDSKSSATIGFDIGGTNLRAGVVDADGHVLAAEAAPTPRTAEELEDAVAGLVDKLSRDHEVQAVGLAVAGFLDPECETVRFAPHLPWRDAPVRARLERRLSVPVSLEHDANAAAWGEHRYGAGRGARTWVLFAVGTGIGAALMIDGEIYRGAYGTAGEFGHLSVFPGGRVCSCGKSGCLERYASGTALVDTARELRPRFPDSALARDLTTGVDVTGATVMADARKNDPLAKAVLSDFAGWLGRGLGFVADILDPELIVIGGGVAHDADLFLSGAKAALHSEMVGSAHRPAPRLATTQLGGRAGMIGVADLARARTFGA